MPAKMASFSCCHSAGVVASISASSGPPEAERRRHAPGRVERVDEAVRPGLRISSSGGMKDQALVSMRISELTRSGRLRTRPMTTRPPMECPRRSTGPPPDRLEERGEVGGELVDGVALEAARSWWSAPWPRWSRVTTRRSAGQGVGLEREVVGRAGEAVTEHERRRPLRAAPPFGPCQVDAVDVEGLGRSRRLCHGPCLAAGPLRPLGRACPSPLSLVRARRCVSARAACRARRTRR